MSAALSRAAKKGNLRRGDASAGARSRRWASPSAPGTRTSVHRSRVHRGTWRTAPAAKNSRLGLAPPARVLAPGLRRSKHANGIRKMPSFAVNAPCTDTSTQGGNTRVLLADNRVVNDPFMTHSDDGSIANWTIPIVPVLAPVGGGGVGALQFGRGGLFRFLGALFRFSGAERGVVSETTTILASPQMAQLRAAYAAGTATAPQVGNRLIQYEPNLPASGLSAFGANGFVLGPQAFSRGGGELAKTVLHELYRLSASNLNGLAQQLGSM
jgi:hypothetical protein